MGEGPVHHPPPLRGTCMDPAVVVRLSSRARAIGCAACLGMLAACSAAAAAEPARLALKQIFDLQWAADPRIAPNGKHVVFVRSGYDIMNDDNRHSVWIVG